MLDSPPHLLVWTVFICIRPRFTKVERFGTAFAHGCRVKLASALESTMETFSASGVRLGSSLVRSVLQLL